MSEHVQRHGSLTLRDDWESEERRRVEDGLAEARHWQVCEPHKSDFFTTFWEGMLEVQYPAWKWEYQPQAGLVEFAGGEEA